MNYISKCESCFSVYLIEHDFTHDKISVIHKIENITKERKIHKEYEFKQRANELNESTSEKEYVVMVDSKKINEGLDPSVFMKIGRYLVEIQDTVINKDGHEIILWKVFVDGRRIGNIFKRKNNKKYECLNNTFDDLNEAIAFLVNQKARPARAIWTTGDII